MKKTLLAFILALTLSGCARGGDTLALPKITYAAAPAATAPPQQTVSPPAWRRPETQELKSQISELNIMDEGFKANLAAGIGDTLLAADAGSTDYQLVLARYVLSPDGTVSITDRRVLLQSHGDAQEEYESVIYGVTASPDRRYCVLTGEAPRAALYIDVEADSYEIKRNPGYSGKYRLITYSADGERLGFTDYPALPTDGVGVFTASGDGKYLIFGYIYETEDGKDEFDFNTIESSTLSVLEPETGEQATYPLGRRLIRSACAAGDGALAYGDFQDEGRCGFCRVDTDDGELQNIEWEWAFGEAESTHYPYCFASDGEVYINNQSCYGLYDADTHEFTPVLNSAPEELPIVIELPGGDSFSDYPQFITCCRVGERSFIGTAGNSAPLYLVSPLRE